MHNSDIQIDQFFIQNYSDTSLSNQLRPLHFKETPKFADPVATFGLLDFSGNVFPKTEKSNIKIQRPFPSTRGPILQKATAIQPSAVAKPTKSFISPRSDQSQQKGRNWTLVLEFASTTIRTSTFANRIKGCYLDVSFQRVPDELSLVRSTVCRTIAQW